MRTTGKVTVNLVGTATVTVVSVERDGVIVEVDGRQVGLSPGDTLDVEVVLNRTFEAASR